MAWSYPSAPATVGSSGRGALGSRCYRERGGVGSALRCCWSSQSINSLASMATTSRSVAASRGISSGDRIPSGVAAWRTAAGRAGRARGRGPGDDRRRGVWDGGLCPFSMRGWSCVGLSGPVALSPRVHPRAWAHKTLGFALRILQFS
jgi:hypothetical protein